MTITGMVLTVSWTRKSFAIVGMIHCRTIEIYDYAGGGVYMIRYDAILNCLQKYA